MGVAASQTGIDEYFVEHSSLAAIVCSFLQIVFQCFYIKIKKSKPARSRATSRKTALSLHQVRHISTYKRLSQVKVYK